MTEHISVLKKCPLFAGIDQGDIPGAAGLLGGPGAADAKGGIPVFRRGQAGEYGRGPGGQRTGSAGGLLGQPRHFGGGGGLGGLFGEAFVCARAETLPVSVVGHKEGSVLLIGRDPGFCRPRPPPAASTPR